MPIFGRRITETEGGIRDVHVGNRGMNRGLRGRDVKLEYSERDLGKATKMSGYNEALQRTGNIHQAAAEVLGRRYTPPESE